MSAVHSLLFAATLCLVAAAPAPAAIQDDEQASHADTAARYQIVDTYEFPGFEVTQLDLAVLSQYSYALVSKNEALIVDPGRDAQVYVELAKAKGWTLRGVFLTHSHADFVAGHVELAKQAVPVYASESSKAGFPHQPLKEGSTLKVGDATVRFLETPGHTLDSLSACVYSTPSDLQPKVVFTGDALFAGSVGRPDLFGGTMSAAELASKLFDSWTQKLAKLDDATVVLSAHGAGSLCGAHLSPQPSTTIGAERRGNPYLQHRARSDFIAAVIDGQPEAPGYFRHAASLNRDGPEPVDWAAPLPADSTQTLTAPLPADTFVVDLRDAKSYAAGHVPGSLNIALRGRLETWVGIMVPWEARLHLLGGDAELTEAVRRLHRVGYRAAGVVRWDAWKAASKPIASNELMAPRALHELMRKGEAPVVVDVRLPSEWMASRIGYVVNAPLDQLARLAPNKLDPKQPVVAVCNSAFRSSMAVGVLERAGFARATSLDGGTEAWLAAGLPVAQSSPSASTEPARLPDRIDPAELSRLLMDLPGGFEIVDIRPAAHFADYSLPGSRNVEAARAIQEPSLLQGTLPLVIVDRDGSLAMAVAGILAQRTARPVKALHGGLQGYWKGETLPTTPAAPASAPAAAPAQPAKPAAKKSAGC